MSIWKLVSILSHSEDPDWEKLICSTLGSRVHPNRKKTFFLSREALQIALKEQGLNPKIPDLFLKGFDQVAAYPQLTISLSHTEDCGAALIAERKDFRSVGIDIENKSRIVKPMIRERIAHPQDENFSDLEVWCLKEAAFKTLMNGHGFERPIEFASIRLGQGQWFHSPSGLSGEWQLQERGSILIALAFLKN